jgi:uncharacterized LabA/DUF88 family protein
VRPGDEMTARAAFLVDGFNLYHSVREAETVLNRPSRWLDIRSLCTAQLSAIAATVGRCDVQQIHYYSAFAHHVEAFRPGTVRRHETYVEALRSTGISVEMAQFKQRERRCPHCKRMVTSYEEKETDVALAARLIELAVAQSCDTVVLVTGDTDLVPAVRVAKRLSGAISVGVAFPYKRMNLELKGAADYSFKLTPKLYAAHQFSDPVIVAGGRLLHKPSSW